MSAETLRIWDNHNKQWLEPMSIYFGVDNKIERINACVKGADPIKDGWYDLKGKDLEKIAIIGYLSFNPELLPHNNKTVG